MKTLNRDYLGQKIKESKKTMKQLSEESKKVDPAGKGVVPMTFSRAKNYENEIYVNSLMIVCETLGISPLCRNLWIDVEAE